MPIFYKRKVMGLQMSIGRIFIGLEISNFRSYNQLNLSCLLDDRIYFREFKIQLTHYLAHSIPCLQKQNYQLNFFFTYFKLYLNGSEIIDQLHLAGSIEEAESDCLYAFKKLSWLKIDFFNLEALLSRNSEWLFKYLNGVENDLEVIFKFSASYQFPDEDICLFRKFPKNRPIVPILQAKSCSCTTIWILQNDDSLRKKKIDELNLYLCSNKTCDFDKMISKCVEPKSKKFVKNKIDFLYDTSKIAFVLGLLMNTINVWILSGNDKENNFQSLIFKLMITNSILNFIYCFINLFHLINMCIFFNGFLCSKFYRSVLAQLYDIYFVEFFGSILKTLSNCLMAMISIDRYFLIKGNFQLENLCAKFQKVRIIYKMPLILLALCTLVYLHSIRIWTSKINNSIYFSQDYYSIREFPIKYFFRESTPLKIERNELHIRIGLFLNLFVLLILRMLEFGILMHVFLGILINSSCSLLPQVCTNFLDLSKLFYLLSCSQSIIVYSFLSEKFNTVFFFPYSLLVEQRVITFDFHLQEMLFVHKTT
ncbi:hypothetical protein BpHYR1_016453 [Brachionus plicatilis]|uniref:Uncharacterized protein n=1 Tax=Brachionus plicatilis TaxID=10195 RepID=A0A3M7QZT2_BRAPC|nr:hypothetical protein BpHYR1_016453 [Brachionus plicatilis]